MGLFENILLQFKQKTSESDFFIAWVKDQLQLVVKECDATEAGLCTIAGNPKNIR